MTLTFFIVNLHTMGQDCQIEALNKILAAKVNRSTASSHQKDRKYSQKNYKQAIVSGTRFILLRRCIQILKQEISVKKTLIRIQGVF